MYRYACMRLWPRKQLAILMLNFLRDFGEYHSWWCPSSFRRQDIPTRPVVMSVWDWDVFLRGQISTIYVTCMSVSNYYSKYEYVAVVSQINSVCQGLTHLPLDKMAAISQTIFSCAFSWMKVLYFEQKFVHKGPIDNNLSLVQKMAIIWTNTDLVHWCINAPLNGDELINEIMSLHVQQFCQYVHIRDEEVAMCLVQHHMGI